MTGAGEPSWREKRTAPKVSFGFSPIKKLYAVDSSREIEVALINWAMGDNFIAHETHDHLNKVFFMIAD